MTDDELMAKLSAQSSPTNNSFDNKNFTPIKEGVKKGCPCNSKPDTNINTVSTTNSNDSFVAKIKQLFDTIINSMKNIAGERDIYKAISLYEFYLTIVLLVLIISVQNTFLLLLLLGLYSRQIPEMLLKVFVSRSKGELINWAKRPDGARDCNMFNAGGDASNNSGLVSSHTFLISSLIFYNIYLFTDNFKQNMNYKQYIFIVLLLLWTFLVALARIRLGCHYKQQTVNGFILGIVWGYIIYIIIEIIKRRVPRIAIDQDKVIRYFE